MMNKLTFLLAIVTANDLGLGFPPRNLLKKFRPDPSTFYLVIVVTDKQTDRQTDKRTPVIPQSLAKAFAGITRRERGKVGYQLQLQYYSCFRPLSQSCSRQKTMVGRRTTTTHTHTHTHTFNCPFSGTIISYHIS